MAPLREPLFKELADETNKADGTYYYYFRPDGRENILAQFLITGTVTITLEVTGSPDKNGSPTYVDKTSDALGAASYTASGIVQNKVSSTFSLASVTLARFKVVVAGGGTDDYQILLNMA